MRNSYKNAPPFVQEIVDRIIDMEGGYVDHKDDTGGETKYGVTEKVARANGYEGHMSELTITFAQDLYVTEYYLAPKFNLVEEVSETLAKEMMDSGVNVGYRTPIKWFQRLLNVSNCKQKYYKDIEVDGYLGSKSIGAYTALCKRRGELEAERYMFNGLNSFQQVYYVELAERREKDETFVYGQIVNRVEYLPF